MYLFYCYDNIFKLFVILVFYKPLKLFINFYKSWQSNNNLFRPENRKRNKKVIYFYD